MQESERQNLDEERRIYEAKFEGLKALGINARRPEDQYHSFPNSSRDWDSESSIRPLASFDSEPGFCSYSPISTPAAHIHVHDIKHKSILNPETNGGEPDASLVASGAVEASHPSDYHDAVANHQDQQADARCEQMIASLDSLLDVIQGQLLARVAALAHHLRHQRDALRRAARDGEAQLARLAVSLQDLAHEHAARRRELDDLAGRKSELEAFLTAAAAPPVYPALPVEKGTACRPSLFSTPPLPERTHRLRMNECVCHAFIHSTTRCPSPPHPYPPPGFSRRRSDSQWRWVAAEGCVRPARSPLTLPVASGRRRPRNWTPPPPPP